MELTFSEIQYYAREGYWHHIVSLCNEELRKGGDAVLQFWRSFAIFKEGSTPEAIRELDNISKRREIQYAASVALVHYHKSCSLVDQEAVTHHKSQKSNLVNSAPDVSLIVAAQFLSLVGKYLKARQQVMQVLERNPANLQALNVLAWVEINGGVQGDMGTADRALDQVIEEADEMIYTKFVDCLLGKAKLFNNMKKFSDTLEILNDLLVKNPRFVPGLVEKAKVQMMTGNWDELVESSQKILAVSRDNIEALRIWTFHALAREASYDLAIDKLKHLHSALVKREPKNAHLYIQVVKPLAQITGRNRKVLQETLSIVQEARKLKSHDVEVLCEVGEQLRYLGDYNAAINSFTEASQLDEGNMQAITKIIHCKILQGHLDEASAQMEFLFEIDESSKQNPELTYLASMLAWRKNHNMQEAIKYLNEALSLHVAVSKKLNPGFEFYTKLNPDFLLEIAKEYLQYVGLKPLPKSAKPPHYLVRATKLLETITKQIPGIIDGHLMLAKSKYISNDNSAAQRYINISLHLDPDCIEALILSALIHMQTDQYLAASRDLEQAMARNFMIRENALFMLVKGQVELKQGKAEEALKTFQTAMKLPGVSSPPVTKKNTMLSLSEEDRAMVFTNLALTYAENKDFQAASRVMAEAIGEFEGTPAEVTVVVANSEIAIKKGDIKQALNILKGITPESPHFKQAKTAMADIYLGSMQNRRLYAKCFYDIVEQEDSVENYLLLGEALMSIQEPEEAITVYEKALKKKPEDLFLTKEIGRALVLTHDYQKAIQYYESAARSDSRKSELLTDLSKLYLRLKDYQSANLVLEQALKKPPTDISSMSQAARNYLLQAQVYIKSSGPLSFSPIPSALESLQNARSVQKDLLSYARDMPPDQVAEERNNCAEINFHLGEYHQYRNSNLDSAVEFYQEALKYNESHEKAIMALAKVYEKQGKVDQCMHYCNRMVIIDPSHEEASTLMAELLLQRNQEEEALTCFKRLLENKAGNYTILAKLLSVLKRGGKLQQFAQFLHNAEKTKGRSADAGVAYCKGLYLRYQGLNKEALEELNKARNDAAYGQPTLEQMIDIYLYSEEELLSGKVPPQNIEAAETLLQELRSKFVSMRSEVLQALLLIAKGGSSNLDKGCTQLEQLLNNKPYYVPGILACAVGKHLQGSQQNAFQLLSRLDEIAYTNEFAEDMERGWLMKAELDLQSKKLQSAQELLHKCLRYNQSCAKAKELLGSIKERENNHKEASAYYEAAWNLSHSASVGFRLAFNYLKENKFLQAIDVSKQVLKRYPDYPRIKKEILEKSREALRP